MYNNIMWYNITGRIAVLYILSLMFFERNWCYKLYIVRKGAKGDWDFRISDLVKNPDGTDI